VYSPASSPLPLIGIGRERGHSSRRQAHKTQTRPLLPSFIPFPSLPLFNLSGAGRGVYPPVVPYPADSTFTSDNGAYPLSAAVHGSPGALAAALVGAVKAAAAEAIASRGAFALAVSGGSVHTLLSALAKDAGPDAAKWTVVLADERAVGGDSPHCNVSAAARAWVGSARVRALLPPLPTDASLATDATRAAQAAAGALLAAPREALPLVSHSDGENSTALLPVFDLVVLGIGDDGHIAGLFPNRPEITSPPSGPWVLPVTDLSPTPPHVPRWSLSLPVLNAAKAAIVVAAGAHKASAVARSLETQALPGAAPAQLLRPVGGVIWMVDADAGSQLRADKWGDAKAWARNAVGGSKD